MQARIGRPKFVGRTYLTRIESRPIPCGRFQHPFPGALDEGHELLTEGVKASQRWVLQEERVKVVKRLPVVPMRATQPVGVADFIRFVSDHSVVVEITEGIVAPRTSE